MVTAAEAQAVRGRQFVQQRRIAQGAASGQLTRPETRRLERQKAALQREIVRDSISGGRLGPAERARIGRQENRLSGEIYALKHNGRTR